MDMSLCNPFQSRHVKLIYTHEYAYVRNSSIIRLIPSTHNQRYSFVHTTQRQARVRLEDQG